MNKCASFPLRMLLCNGARMNLADTGADSRR